MTFRWPPGSNVGKRPRSAVKNTINCAARVGHAVGHQRASVVALSGGQSATASDVSFIRSRHDVRKCDIAPARDNRERESDRAGKFLARNEVIAPKRRRHVLSMTKPDDPSRQGPQVLIATSSFARHANIGHPAVWFLGQSYVAPRRAWL
jgi:hypothetical protein